MVSKTPNIETYTVSGTYPVDLGYDTHLVTLSSGITVDLQLSSLTPINDGKHIRFKRQDTTNSILTVSGVGDNIYPIGTNSTTIPILEELHLVYKDSNWYIISDQEAGGTGNLLETQHLFVDSVVGNDGTAEINNPAKAWKTITSAVTASAPLLGTGNYLIYVRAGTYTETNLLISDPAGKQRFYFEEGAIIQSSSGNLFSGVTGNAEITGYGIFGPSESPIIDINGIGNLYFEALQVISTASYVIDCRGITSTFKIQGISGSGLNLENSNFEIDTINTSGIGLTLSNCRGQVNLIQANVGVIILGDINLQVQRINSATAGIQINSGISNLDIGVITGNNGLVIAGGATVTASIDTMSTYYVMTSGTVIDTLKIGTITSGIMINGSGNYTSNWDINSIAGGLMILGSANKNLTATIQSLTGGYNNTGTGTFTENLTFGTVDSINFGRFAGCTCDWIINSLNSTGNGIYLNNNAGTGIFNIQANSITAVQDGIQIIGIQNYVINLDIGSINSNLGINNISGGSITLTGKIDKIVSVSTGYQVIGPGTINENLTFGLIESQGSGIYFTRITTNPVTSSIKINSIDSLNGITINNSGGTGIFNIEANSINSVTNAILFSASQTYISNLNLNHVTGLNCIQLVNTSNSQFRITGNNFTGIGLLVNSNALNDITLNLDSISNTQYGLDINGPVILNGEIRNIVATIAGYRNRGIGLVTEDLNFGSVQAPTGILYQKPSGNVTSNLIIDSIMGISVGNTGGTGIFNLQVNSITSGTTGIYFTGTQLYTGTLDLNAVNAGTDILFRTAGISTFNLRANSLVGVNEGIRFENSAALTGNLDINSITEINLGIVSLDITTGIITLNGSINSIVTNNSLISGGLGVLGTNIVNANLSIGFILANIGIYAGSNTTLNGYIDRITADSKGIEISRSNSLPPMNLEFGTIQSNLFGIQSKSGLNNFYGRQITGNPGNIGIAILGGQTKAIIDSITGFNYGVEMSGGAASHQIFTNLIDANINAILGQPGYTANFIMSGSFITRGATAAVYLKGPATPGNTTAAIRLMPGCLLQSGSTGPSDRSLFADNPVGMTITMEGRCTFYPLPSTALTYQNNASLRTTLTTSLM